MKKIKILGCIFLILGILTLTFCLAACSNKPNTEEIQLKINTAEDTATEYVDSILKADFTTALFYLDMPQDSPFINESDIEYAIGNSQFAAVAEVGYQEYILKTGETEEVSDVNKIIEVKVCNAKEPDYDFESVYINVYKTDDNTWYVVDTEMYYQNVSFVVPGGNTEVYIDNTKLGSEYISNGSSGLYGLEHEYTLPYMGKRGVDVTIKSNNFETTKKITYSSSNQSSAEVVDIYVSSPDECFTYIKEAWNGLNELYVAGKEVESAKVYISDSADKDTAQMIWDIFDKLYEPRTISSDRDDDFKLTKCIGTEEKPRWITDNKIYVPFNYELTWYYVLANWQQDMHRESEIILEFSDSMYKLDNVLDIDLFSQANNFIMEW